MLISLSIQRTWEVTGDNENTRSKTEIKGKIGNVKHKEKKDEQESLTKMRLFYFCYVLRPWSLYFPKLTPRSGQHDGQTDAINTLSSPSHTGEGIMYINVFIVFYLLNNVNKCRDENRVVAIFFI